MPSSWVGMGMGKWLPETAIPRKREMAGDEEEESQKASRTGSRPARML